MLVHRFSKRKADNKTKDKEDYFKMYINKRNARRIYEIILQYNAPVQLKCKHNYLICTFAKHNCLSCTYTIVKCGFCVGICRLK